MSADCLLSAEDLTRCYARASKNPPVKALDNFSIRAASGEIVGLLGPNGAGKTTAISIMGTLLKPTSGRVTICGMDTAKHTRKIRGIIGLVPQDIALYGNLTARENLSFFGRMHGLKGRGLKERVAECLDLAGLESRRDQKVNAFSGGMKRRLNLAAARINHPKVMFLDEPTVGIDAQSRNMILEKLAGFKQTDTTIIYTTHYMEEAEFLCDRVAIIDHGRIAAQGPPDALIRRHPPCGNLGDLFLSLTGKTLRD